jgi:hypothetical protein
MSNETEQMEGESQHDFWLRTLHRLGGGGLFLAPREMPEAGAKFPMALTKGLASVEVYDEEELEEARAQGFGNKVLGVEAKLGAKPDAPTEGFWPKSSEPEHQD